MKCKKCDRDMVCVHSFYTISDKEGSVVVYDYNCANNHIGKRIEFVDNDKEDVLTNIKREDFEFCDEQGESQN